MTRSFEAIVDDERRTYGGLDLLKCKPRDTVIVVSVNSMHVITVTEKMYYDDRDRSIHGVLIATTSSRVVCHSDPLLNQVSRYLSIPSQIRINNGRTSEVGNVLLNNVSICPLFR